MTLIFQTSKKSEVMNEDWWRDGKQLRLYKKVKGFYDSNSNPLFTSINLYLYRNKIRKEKLWNFYTLKFCVPLEIKSVFSFSNFAYGDFSFRAKFVIYCCTFFWPLPTFCEGCVRVCCHLPIILAKCSSMKYGSHKNRRRLRRYSVGNSWTGCTSCTIFANLPQWVEILSEGAPKSLRNIPSYLSCPWSSKLS